jgi:integrase
MGLYQRPDSEVYWLSYTSKGKRVRESAGTTDKDEATRIPRDKQGRIARGETILHRADRVRYDEIRADLMTYYSVYGRRDPAEALCRLAHLDLAFTGWKAVDIDEGAVMDYAKVRQQKGAAAGTINRELATLSKMLTLAVRNKRIDRAPTIERLKESDPRSGFVSRQEFDQIAKRLPVELAAAALVGFVYGWRKMEVLSRELRHLDLAAGTLRLDPGESKNGRARVIRLTSELRGVLGEQMARVRTLEQQQGRIIPWLFPHLTGLHAGYPMRDIRKVWTRACRAAGLPEVLFHDLRRSAVKGMIAAGISEKVAMTMTGHLTRSTFDRYHIVGEADLTRAAELLGAPSTLSRFASRSTFSATAK